MSLEVRQIYLEVGEHLEGSTRRRVTGTSTVHSGHWAAEAEVRGTGVAKGEGSDVIVRRPVLVVLLCCFGVSAAGCTSSTHHDTSVSPWSSSATSAVVSSAPATPSATVTSTDSAPSEAGSRQAVEAAWAKFWSVNTRLVAIPSSQIKQEIAAVAVDPTRGQMLSQISVFRSLQQEQYGYVISHPYWTRPIAGKTTAVMGDCMDGSHFGTLSLATGKKLTVGPARDNARATFVRDGASVWRVQLVEYLLDAKC